MSANVVLSGRDPDLSALVQRTLETTLAPLLSFLPPEARAAAAPDVIWIQLDGAAESPRHDGARRNYTRTRSITSGWRWPLVTTLSPPIIGQMTAASPSKNPHGRHGGEPRCMSCGWKIPMGLWSRCMRD